MREETLTFDNEVNVEPSEFLRPGRKRHFGTRRAVQHSRAATVENTEGTGDAGLAPAAANVSSEKRSDLSSPDSRREVRTGVVHSSAKRALDNSCTPQSARAGGNVGSRAVTIPARTVRDEFVERHYVNNEISAFGLPKGAYVAGVGSVMEGAAKFDMDEQPVFRAEDYAFGLSNSDEPLIKALASGTWELQQTSKLPVYPRFLELKGMEKTRRSILESIDGLTAVMKNRPMPLSISQLVLPVPRNTSSPACVATCDSEISNGQSSPVRKRGDCTETESILDRKSDNNGIRNTPGCQQETASRLTVDAATVSCKGSRGEDGGTVQKMESATTQGKKTSPLAKGQAQISTNEANAVTVAAAPPAKVAAEPSTNRVALVLSSSDAKPAAVAAVPPSLATACASEAKHKMAPVFAPVSSPLTSMLTSEAKQETSPAVMKVSISSPGVKQSIPSSHSASPHPVHRANPPASSSKEESRAIPAGAATSDALTTPVSDTKDEVSNVNPKPTPCSQPVDQSRVTVGNGRRQWYIQRLRHCDSVYAEDEAKRIFWVFARYLANEEAQVDMIKRCIDVIPTEDDMSAVYNRLQRLASYFLRVCLRHLPSPVVSFLLSNEHRRQKTLPLPPGLKSIDSVEKYLKESDVYHKLMRNAICGEEKMQAATAKTTSQKGRGRRSAPAFIRFPAEDDVLDWRKWWTAYSEVEDQKHTIEHYIICGGIKLLKDNSGFLFVVETVENEATVSKLLRNSPDGSDEINATDGSDEINVTDNNTAGIALWMSTDLLLHETQRKKPFPLIMHRIEPTQSKCRRRHGTHLPTFFRHKSHRCSVEELISWPWADKKVGNLVTEVRCLVRFNITLRNLRKIDAQSTHKKNRGKRGKRGRTKARLGFREKDHVWDWQANMDLNMASGDRLASDNGSSTFTTCRDFLDDGEMKDIRSSCKATTVFPLYEQATRRLVFYSAVGNGEREGAAREVPSVFPHKLPEVFGQVDESVGDIDCWITDSTPLTTVSTSAGSLHHHGNLVVDILLPKFPSEAYALENLLADVTLLLRSLTGYARDVYVHLFASDMEEMEGAQKQIKETQMLCENIFSLIVFGEMCGFAELRLRAGYYITSAQRHYSKARDIAIDIGILPVFFGFLRDHVAKFPECYRIAKRVRKVFFALLPFLDLSPRDPTGTANAKMNYHGDVALIQPIAVSILESVMKQGYTDGVDDDIAFRALQCRSNDPEHPAYQDMALISPVAESGFSPHARLRQRGFRNVRFGQKNSESLRRKTEYLDQILDDVVKEFRLCEDTAENCDAESGDKLPPKCDNRELWEIIHDIMSELQMEEPPGFDKQMQDKIRKSKAERIYFTPNTSPGDGEMKRPQTPPRNGSSENEQKEQSPEKEANQQATDVAKPDPGESAETEGVETQKESAEPKGERVDPPNAAEKQDDDNQETVKVQVKTKKSNRGHMSTEKRQQRQAQRLKKKWQKKHRDVTGSDRE